jgi:hypothetical protein
MADKISIYQTSTSTVDGKTTTSKTERSSPGKAWVRGTGKDKGFWVKPATTEKNVAWDDNKGWVSAASQATAWDIPLAIINSDPKLKALFNEAWTAQKRGEEWTQETFTTKLKQLPWYTSRSEAQRKYYVLSKDPAQAAEFNRQIQANKQTVLDTAGLIGATLTDAQALDIAKRNLQNGFNSSELQNLISSYVSFSGKTDQEKIGSLFGAAGEAEDEIRRLAKKNNVTLSEDWILAQARGITAGQFDVNKSKDYITNIAKRQYSAWADQIDNNTTVEDLAAGFIQTYASEFGEDTTNVNMKNKYIENAMKSVDDKGRPIDNQAFIKTIRKTNDWANVAKNKEKILGVGQDILKTFGMR